MQVADNGMVRIVTSEDYNMVFRKYNKVGNTIIPDGTLLRWGKTTEEDPEFCPYGPEILDVEISAGKCESNCKFCYKNNSSNKPLKNMSLKTYKKVLDKVSSTGTLGQIALGITGVKDNPDLLDIMRYTRDRGCWPNFTLTGADLDLPMAADLAELCGALAVSCSSTNPDLCFDTIKLFTDLGVEQSNIHVVVAEETIPFVHQVLDARMNDPRLKNMGAVVCLMVKPKGRAKGRFHSPSQEKYEELVHKILKNNIPAGFDSCSALRFLNAAEKADFLSDEEKKELYINSDPCESFCFSLYVNVDGIVSACSFCEEEPGHESINLLEAEDFIEDVWMSPVAKKFRENLLSRGRSCPAFQEIDSCLSASGE